MSHSFLATAKQSQFANNILRENGTVDELLKDSKLDYSFKRSPLTYEVDGKTRINEGVEQIYHSKTGNPMGIVSPRYKLVQPRTVMNFYNKLAEKNNCKLEAAGYSNGGASIWAMADTGMDFRIKGQDQIRGYLMFYTANDGSSATTIKLSSYRMACANQLHAIMSEELVDADGRTYDNIKIRHLTEINWDELYDNITYLLNTHWVTFKEQTQKLAERTVSNQEVIDYYMTLFDTEEKSKKVERMIELYQGGVGQNLVSSQGTAWGLVNAVTRYYDHESKARNDANRFKSAQFGVGANTKEQAFREALKLVA